LYVPAPWNVWLNDAPFANPMAPFVKLPSPPDPPDVPLHAPLAQRVTVCCTPEAFTHVTVLPSLTVIDAGEKQKSAPPQPVDWIVTVGSLPVAAPAGAVQAASEAETNPTDANSTANDAANLRMSPPPRASAPYDDGRGVNALHTQRAAPWFTRIPRQSPDRVNPW
jgi:hypothetical protein